LTVTEELPDMAQYSINQLIINSPYAEPTSYWAYHRATRFFTRNEGRRGT
jgi:hypothetical protein